MNEKDLARIKSRLGEINWETHPGIRKTRNKQQSDTTPMKLWAIYYPQTTCVSCHTFFWYEIVSFFTNNNNNNNRDPQFETIFITFKHKQTYYYNYEIF